ncbi:MAG: cupin domain-containing protein [Deltaproteobacteria bacterium]|nr:cupin domain-containing protein [Deltaproteobacteria bacterium]
MGHASAQEKDIVLGSCAWGSTATVFGPENVGTRFARVKITEYAPGTTHSLHQHPNEEEIIYVLDGKGVSKTATGELPMGPGTFVYIPAGTDHTTINLDPDKPLRTIIIKAPPGPAGL